MHTVFLTGASGFVGDRVARRLLASGHHVKALMRSTGSFPATLPGLPPESAESLGGRFTALVGDFVDRSTSLRAAEGCDVVIHCAAGGDPDLAITRRVNTEGTASVLAAAREVKARRFLHVSTGAVYPRHDGALIAEDSPLVTQGHPYGITKAEADRLVLAEIDAGCRATIFRPACILGLHPTSTWSVEVPVSIRERQTRLKHDGGDTMGFLHVDDLVDVMLGSIESARAVGRVYNVVDEHTTWRTYSDQVRGWFGTPPLDSIPKAELPAGAYWTGRYDASRIRDELGYKPSWTFARGMEEAQAYWTGR